MSYHIGNRPFGRSTQREDVGSKVALQYDLQVLWLALDARVVDSPPAVAVITQHQPDVLGAKHLFILSL